MTPFRSAPAGYVARWEPLERQVLARVARDVADLLRAESGIGPDTRVGDGVAFTGVGRVPQDPAVLRLLPDAHREDADVAAEFRHLTQTDLAAGKAARLESFVELLDPADAGDDLPRELVVARDAAQEFAGALTDVRLVLAERLDLTDDADVEALHDAVLAGVDVEDTDDGFDDDDDGDGGGGGDGMLSAAARQYWGGVFVAAGFAQETLMEEMLDELRAGRG